MFLSPLRKPVDRFFPSAGRFYRSIRDLCVNSEARSTRYGFTLAGEPLIAREDFEVDEVRVFLRLLETHDIVLDLGANVGFYTCLAASRGKHVLSFEPSPRNLKFLYRNLWENNLSDAEIFPVGLAKHCGLSRVYGSGSIASFVPGWARAETSNYSLVPVTTLDAAIAKRFPGQRLLIKMDVEGFELDVLAGAIETLDLSPKPAWLVEILLQDVAIPERINARFQETFEVFWKHGYHCAKLDEARAPMLPVDVERWVASGAGECKNFLFTSAPGPGGIRQCCNETVTQETAACV